MNIYEQLQAVKDELEQRNARAKTIRVIDQMIARAEGQRNNALSVSRLQVLRHVMRTPEVLNDEDVRLDFIALEGDLEDAAAQRGEAAAAYETEDRRPKLKKYYKKK
ncbi:MAG: hypothetical protein JOZ41_03360 [Chloroflexi bacterium]|nr:hypothetical protein [Chloroflexota bacterium]